MNGKDFMKITKNEDSFRNLMKRVSDDFKQFFVMSIALDGIVIDAEKAKLGPCKCINLDSGKRFCWDRGVVGALSEEQEAEFCTPANTTYTKGGKLKSHLEQFANASETCKIGNVVDNVEIKNIYDRIGCMEQNAGGAPIPKPESAEG